MRMLIGVAVVVLASNPALAETLTCSVWQGIRTCADAHGYVSHETQWQGMIIRDDNRSNSGTTSRWQGIDTTTVTPPQQDFK